jgi:hypothetical protein
MVRAMAFFLMDPRAKLGSRGSFKRARARFLPGFALDFAPFACAAIVASPAVASAAEPTPGYQEPVIQWVVQKGETCASIATSAYGSPKLTALLGRYSRVRCGGDLPEGLTLVIPASATALPDARVKSLNPAVKARPAGGAFGSIAPGAPLQGGHSVQTEATGRADIEFLDRTRIFLADNTLVVIHGTAARTSVKKNVPPVVELESGEVKAGLAALRGDAVEIGVSGGGRVSATSKDAVVEKKGTRTTVAVFDGTATLANAGKSVSIPKNFGARAEGQKPPEPPRPLPPAPAWSAASQGPAGFPDLALTLLDRGPEVVLGWDEVAKAKAYRVEISRDAGFNDLLVRTEVPATTRTLRAEGLVPGAYWIAVRAIDTEEFLGLAAVRRHVVVAAAPKTGPARLEGDTLSIAPFTSLGFPPSGSGATGGLRLALGTAPASAAPVEPIALGKLDPGRLTVSTEDGLTRSFTVVTRRPTAKTSVVYDATGKQWTVKGELLDVTAGDAATFVKPVVRLPAGSSVVASALTLTGTSFAGSLTGDFAGGTLVIADAEGNELGRATAEGGPSAPPPPPDVLVPSIGATAPFVSSSPDVAGSWSSPTLPRAGSVSGLGAFSSNDTVFAGSARATGAAGPIGFEASVRSRGSSASVVDEGAWLGVRARVLRLGLARFELAPVVRVGVPITPAGPIARVEPAIALGGVSGSISWLGQVGGRFRGSEDQATVRMPVAAAQGFANVGAAYRPGPLVTAYGVLDGQVHPDVRAKSDDVVVRGGLSAGVEVGRTVFGGFGARVTPFDAPTGPFEAQVTFGVRER